MTWRNGAACKEENPELFSPIGHAHLARPQIEEAKVVCGRCDVVQTCLKWAMDSDQDFGVWGGLSEDERHTLNRRNARARGAGLATTAARWGPDIGPRPHLNQQSARTGFGAKTSKLEFRSWPQQSRRIPPTVWNEIFTVLVSLGVLFGWGIDSATRTGGRYRYPVKAPLDPSLADNLPEYVPDSWTNNSR